MQIDLFAKYLMIDVFGFIINMFVPSNLFSEFWHKDDFVWGHTERERRDEGFETNQADIQVIRRERLQHKHFIISNMKIALHQDFFRAVSGYIINNLEMEKKDQVRWL